MVYDRVKEKCSTKRWHLFQWRPTDFGKGHCDLEDIGTSQRKSVDCLGSNEVSINTCEEMRDSER